MAMNLLPAVEPRVHAFCNTTGGELLIGVADDKAILGIQHDQFPNDDKFLLHLRNLLLERIIPGDSDEAEQQSAGKSNSDSGVKPNSHRSEATLVF